MAGSTARTALYEPAVLYEDSFVRVSESDVAVKRFFFPFGTRKVIAGADVASVQNAATLDVLRIGQCKRWGMALNNIWWALDWQRDDFGCGKSRYVSVVVTLKPGHGCFRYGFSVEDEAAAQQALQQMLTNVSPGAEVWI
mmetsp:Transcript_40203/g.102939  ORF Transcript_40203/g.102939 Transcript_40203/m.102939 type:complete len:140 (-) Transcript_40203:596-1015(-)|eukprot:jgi/Tetstr1/445708/TSEL_003507.t1